MIYTDPLLASLAEEAHRKARTDTTIRLLIAYARNFAGHRPYTLTALAEASGYPISGVARTYTAHDEALIQNELHDLQRHTLAPHEFYKILNDLLDRLHPEPQADGTVYTDDPPF